MAPVPAALDSTPFMDSLHRPLLMLAVIPFVYIGYRFCRTIIALTKAIFIYVIAPLFYKPNLSQYVNRWTVVTGGTDGIGKAYVTELAKRGLRKFVLIGRNPTKLSDVKTFLELTYGCRVKTYLFDFSKDDFAPLREYLSEIDIGFVVNSVGVGRENLERYGDNPEADQQILRVNGLGAAEFLSMVLPPMERCGGGQIVVLSSSQGIKPIPLLAAYSSAKSVLVFLSEAIDREYRTISVQCLTPALVATKMVYYEKGSTFVVTPENFVKEAVNTIGLTKKTSGCFNHEIQMLVYHLFPWTILKYLLMPIYYHHRKRMDKIHAKAKHQLIARSSAKA
ncbi:unnamed protein product [Haemonchus placei]|uniref:Estradiol 17-beta-dehydrogenase 12 n=1 Tax=Haemonchus placei TaxID=6290 RepID=A0A0N4W634_HAEPC|nr:unnamed protein product [Haemonchus placei]